MSETEAPAHADEPQAEEPSLSASASALKAALAEVVDTSLRLLALESRLAGLSLSAMVMLALGVALLLASSWLFFMAALAVWLVSMGLSWTVVLVGVGVSNLLLSLPLFYLIERLSRNLLFPATRRQLGLAHEHEPADPT